jgi:hypothetical protein
LHKPPLGSVIVDSPPKPMRLLKINGLLVWEQ